jgi:hypothetical protein
MRAAKLIVLAIAAAWSTSGTALLTTESFLVWLVAMQQVEAEAKLKASCTLASRADANALRTMEAGMERQLAEVVEHERVSYRIWKEVQQAQDPRNPDSLQKATDARIGYLSVRLFAVATVEAYADIKRCIAERHRVLAAPRPTPTPAQAPAQNVPNGCATTAGPVQCTGQFEGPFRSRCTGGLKSIDQGKGVLTIGADGSAMLRLYTDRGGESSEVAGTISPSGDVLIQKTEERYQGRFTVEARPDGVRRLVGGGTYTYRSAIDDDRCDGTFTIAR